MSAPKTYRVKLLIPIIPRKNDRRQIPGLDEKEIDRKRIHNYRQRLERIKRYTESKYDIDIGQLIKEGTITETEWNTKEKIQQNFILALESEATHQKARSEYRTEPHKIKIDKLTKLYRIIITGKKQMKLTKVFWAKQPDTETPEGHIEIIELEKECDSSDFTTELLESKIRNSKTDKKLRDKLMKETDLDVPKTIEQIQQNAYDRKKTKRTPYRKH